MQSFTFLILLLAFLPAYALEQDLSGLASPGSHQDSNPSNTSYGTAANVLECTGCLLEAISPSQLSYPGTIYCLDVYTITTIPSVIQYTYTASDGCTSHSYSPYPQPTQGPVSTTSITWDLDGTCLTWPTTYLAYSTFQVDTWSYCGSSDCAIHSTTVTVQSPIIYPTTPVPGGFAPVPSQIVESILHDPSISLPYNISTCTASNAQPGAYVPDATPSPSCIKLPPTTYTIPNTFISSTKCSTPAPIPPPQPGVALNAVDAVKGTADQYLTLHHTIIVSFGHIDGVNPNTKSDRSGSMSSSASTSASSTPSSTLTSSEASTSSSTSTNGRDFSSSSSGTVSFIQ